MGKGTKVKINLDKLEICYVGSKDLIDNIEDTKHWEKEHYYLEYEESENKDKRETILSIYVDDVENHKVKFGTLKFGNSFETDKDMIRYCWLRIENKILYNKSCISTTISTIYWIQDDLDLEFNNITSLDIALDSNINWFKRIKNAIRNELLIPIVLNKAYPNVGEEEIEPIDFRHKDNRRRYCSNTIYINNSDKDMILNVYDKGKEIIKSGKKYIRDWFNSKGNIYRAEIRLKNKSLNEYCDKNNISQYDLYMQILDDNILFDIYYFFSNRLIHFVDSSRNQISFLQL